jgi:hypothetical protein
VAAYDSSQGADPGLTFRGGPRRGAQKLEAVSLAVMLARERVRIDAAIDDTQLAQLAVLDSV